MQSPSLLRFAPALSFPHRSFGAPNSPFSRPVASLCRFVSFLFLHRELAEARGETFVGTLSTLRRDVAAGDALSKCFSVFDAVHRLIVSCDHVRRITREALDDFAEDNAVLVELRTTPKELPAWNVTRRSYVEAVLAGIEDHKRSCGRPVLEMALILSVDRRGSADAAVETVRLAAELRDAGHPVVGVDLCGDPAGSPGWRGLAPALQQARRLGLFVTIHLAELDSMDDETAEILRWRPDRVSHAVHLSAETRAELVRSGIPLEACLSSNVLTGSAPGTLCSLGRVADASDHHAFDLQKLGVPVCLCTDDPGVFETCLSRELAIADFDLAASLCAQRDAVRASFVSEASKAELLERLDAWGASTQC